MPVVPVAYVDTNHPQISELPGNYGYSRCTGMFGNTYCEYADHPIPAEPPPLPDIIFVVGLTCVILIGPIWILELICKIYDFFEKIRLHLTKDKLK